MARIAYNAADAAAFKANRHVTEDSLAAWQAAVIRHLDPQPGMRVLDLGSGTGSWARAFTTWLPDAEIIAVEPSAAMRDHSVFAPVLAGDAAHIPLPDGSVDAVWLSTVVHHIPDLPAAAHELRRVLRPDAPVLIRSGFAGRPERISLFRYFPEAIAVLDTFPSIADVEAAFGAAGFTLLAVEQIPELTATSLGEVAASLRREAHTLLQLIDDDAYAAGLRRLHQAAQVESGPVIDALDLLVLR
ncbi:methyltransferase domain-containing protein [Micromonospora fiedleri]|uniref:Methyltransferase domain-containing protein n=1 Tax=Micromonospora fiedleri TaxID=1157498 RepID=A0ABS1UJA8_9ACTN|nr:MULTISPECIES: class I SAM-dependent methyltransferase [Micromonospora]MBL6276432.1 methyltransferase domain-containing protein [Micromonospora fiedleri]WSK40395.1 methyltransferase domain-containing protein [Micromonospora maris]